MFFLRICFTGHSFEYSLILCRKDICWDFDVSAVAMNGCHENWTNNPKPVPNAKALTGRGPAKRIYAPNTRLRAHSRPLN